MNHSCDPNCWWDEKDRLVARWDIKKGDEVTYDYSTSDIYRYWEAGWECKCKSEVCRHRITRDDILDPDLQIRYQGHIPSWVETFLEREK